MKSLQIVIVLSVLFTLAACANNGPKLSYNPQKIIQSVNAKYPDQRTNLIYIGAPEGFVAPREAVKEVEDGVDAGKVVAIITALHVNTSTVIITGTDDNLNAATLARALTTGKDKVSGSKIVYIGGKESLPHLSKLAGDAGVNIEFMDLPS
jgi:predicted small lipoprotein YifL